MSKISLLPIAFKRYWVYALATFASVIGSSLFYLKVTSPVYESTGRAIISQQQTGVSDLGRDLAQLPEAGKSGANPAITQAELIKSQRVLERAVELYKSKAETPQDVTPGQIKGGLDVGIVPGTNILELTYQDEDPELAAQILNAVLQSVVEDSAEEIRTEASTVRTFLEAEVPRQRARLEQAEANENAFRERSGIISLEDQKRALIDNLATVQREERQVASDLQEAVSRSNYLQQITGANSLNSAYASVRVGQDEELQNLRTSLAELDTQVIAAQSRLGSQHPDLLALLEQRDEKRKLYTQALARVLPNDAAVSSDQIALDELSQQMTSDYIVGEIGRQALSDRLAVLQNARTNLATQVTQLPMKEQQLAILTRQRIEAEETLKLLQTQLEQARLAEAQLVSNVSVIDLAKPSDSPAWPNVPVILLIASAAGIGLAVAVMILLEALNNTFDSTIELEDLARPKVPVLGALPKLPLDALRLQQPGGFVESPDLIEPYRALLKMLGFSANQKTTKLIVVSSTIDGEGKSTVASHLAVVSALLSKKTLLIDADLRFPTQHQDFGIAAYPGLTDIVRNNYSLKEAVKPTNIDSLSILTAGEPLSDGTFLSETSSFRALLSSSAEQYDLVIIDSPSLVRSADAITLGQYSDGVLLVTRPNFTPKGDLRHVLRNLSGSVPMLGVVLNGTKEQSRHYQSFDFYPDSRSDLSLSSDKAKLFAGADSVK